MICPISQGQATEQRTHGTVVTLMGTGTATTGSIHCHQLKSLDWRVRQAKRKESVPAYLVDEVWARLEAIMRPDSRAAHAVFIPQAHHARPFRPVSAVAYGLATLAADGAILDTWYPRPSLADHTPAGGTRHLTPEEARAALGEHVPTALARDTRRKVEIVAVRTAIASLEEPPSDAHDAYLRLHLLSHRLIRPHDANLDGLFNVLSNVAWTSAGPCPVDQIDALRWHLRATGQTLEIRGVDKIPRMTDYVVPQGVRIADTARVRLGAHLSPGTTVLHEGFCNFNAGTLGASMVEGRISAGVIVDDGSDIGGGASIMGTMSGGGKQVVSIGKRCLLGANSGIGISLGDDCVVEAGCYITAGTRVLTPEGAVVKAVSLAGQHGQLFRRNSQTGAVETLVRTAAWGTLNPALHSGH